MKLLQPFQIYPSICLNGKNSGNTSKNLKFRFQTLPSFSCPVLDVYSTCYFNKLDLWQCCIFKPQIYLDSTLRTFMSAAVCTQTQKPWLDDVSAKCEMKTVKNIEICTSLNSAHGLNIPLQAQIISMSCLNRLQYIT